MDIVFVIDDWTKKTEEENRAELAKIGLNDEQTNKLISIVYVTGNNLEKIATLRNILSDIPEAIEALNEIETIITLVNDEKVDFDTTIARGLSYYTGPVWEWIINEGGVGSVGGGGRYDKLVGEYLGREVPATGGAFGFERLMEVMKDRNMLPIEASKTQVMVAVFTQDLIKSGIELAKRFRDSEVNCFLFSEDKQMQKQLSYANKKGIKFVAILGENELKENKLMLKDMTTGEQTMLSFDEALQKIK